MWLAIGLAVLNYALNFLGTRLGRIPGFDILPFGIMMVAWHGDNLFLGTGLLIASYVAVEFHRIEHLYGMAPTILVLSLLALVFQNGYVLLILYHLMGVVIAYLLGVFGQRYITFMVVHLIINTAALQIYGFIV